MISNFLFSSFDKGLREVTSLFDRLRVSKQGQSIQAIDYIFLISKLANVNVFKFGKLM
jgi:hypothetical protein